MNAKEVLKMAKKDGWIVKSQKGSHIKLEKVDSGKVIMIPYHGTKDIPPGTLHQILKQLGLK